MDTQGIQQASPQSAQHAKIPAGAKNFALYFITFALLYTVAINFGAAIFYLINKIIPLVGAYDNGYYSASALRFNLAYMIIGGPIFLFLAARVRKEAARDEVVRFSGIRRWLTYITLIVTALVVICDLIALVNNLLSGETTLRFILKAITVLLIAASIFFYYLRDIQTLKQEADGTQQSSSALARIYFYASSVGLLLVIILGITQLEAPGKVRLRRQDDVRIQHLSELESQVNFYAQTSQSLPADLSMVSLRDDVKIDPVSGAPYEYRMTGATTFELCATFETSNKTTKEAEPYYYGSPWLHDAGRTCFQRNITQLLNQKGSVPPFPQQLQGY